jgi:broad specificity phosphatase PhoE
VSVTLFLVRHVPHELQNKVQVGRREGVKLAADAPERLARLAERFAREDLAAVYASPVFRAQETARAVAAPAGLDVRRARACTNWTPATGRAAASRIRRRPDWDTGTAAAVWPGSPAVKACWRCSSAWPACSTKCATPTPASRSPWSATATPIKAAVLHLLGLSLDAYDRIEIEPGSITTAVFGAWGAKLIRLNEAVYP